MAANTINRLTIQGYKSLANETSLELRPLTILAGANSGGKSSVMQPLLLLKQTLASPSDPGVLEIAGPNVRFNRYDQMFFQCPGKGKSAKVMKFGFSTSPTGSLGNLALHFRLSGQNIELEKQEINFPTRSMNDSLRVLRPGKLSDEVVATFPEQVIKMAKDFNRGDRKFVFMNRLNRGFVDVVLVDENDPSQAYQTMSLQFDRVIRQQLLNLIHVPGLRGNPQRDYLLRKTGGPRFDGQFQDYVAGIVAGWGKKDERTARLGESLKQLGLTWKIETREVDATRVEILVGRLKEPRQGGAKDFVNIADVGFGVSQVLPALVALDVAVPGQIVHLEQPEIHLHPRAQRSLAKILADAARRDARLVVETHSSILIRGIQTLVAQGELDPALVKLHWFTRDESTGVTHVDSADLDENGAFGMDWPEDFDDTYMKAEQEYLDAVEARAFK
ncbi:MAG: DUF3696 domain-containing protein [Verrucomicrobia bacterium]|nr:DUF3696 domain-containing protein [Verrucomicrobiota bacterium]